MWSIETLREFVATRFSDHRLIVVANREPYLHRHNGGEIECVPPVSGMVSALDPIVRACGGTWIAHGSGDADRQTADRFGRIEVPPEDPSYTLRRVWLTKAQENGYYNSIANAGMWPLCHNVFARPEFNPEHWPIYREVNERFADAVLDEAEGGPAFVFVQDYHFGLLPRMVKAGNPNLIVAQFWHIPWPSAEVFQVFPWKEELLDGMLGNDLLAFHLRYHCQNFLSTIDRTIEAKVDYERFEVTRNGSATQVRPFPISIDFDEHSALVASPAVDSELINWQQRLKLSNDIFLGIGIDRIDYTKGLLERLRAVDHLLRQYPAYRGKLQFVQIGVPNRTNVLAYQRLDHEVDAEVERINTKWRLNDWQPIRYFKRQHSPVEMMALHRLADFCVVSSLDDGMNLVAKEFVASRNDDDGVLILSRFTGASRELTSALLVNPFAIDEIAGAMHQAMEMPTEERQKRMQKMRGVVSEYNIYRWAGKLLSALMRLDPAEGASPETEFAAYGRSWK